MLIAMNSLLLDLIMISSPETLLLQCKRATYKFSGTFPTSLLVFKKVNMITKKFTFYHGFHSSRYMACSSFFTVSHTSYTVTKKSYNLLWLIHNFSLIYFQLHSSA